jgi:hypothetical protein
MDYIYGGAVRILGPYVFDVGGKITHLIERVPDWHVEDAPAMLIAHHNGDKSTVWSRVGERNDVFHRGVRR